jgi:hypothetical protein
LSYPWQDLEGGNVKDKIRIVSIAARMKNVSMNKEVLLVFIFSLPAIMGLILVFGYVLPSTKSSGKRQSGEMPKS